MFVVACYDVTDDRLRSRVAALFEEAGMRVQKSVFECLLSERELHELTNRPALILADGDQARFYQLCAKCVAKARQHGGPPLYSEPLLYLV